MAIEAGDVRMARLEHGCERTHERLGLIEHRLSALEPRLTAGMTSLGYEVLSAIDALRTEGRNAEARLRRQYTTQFHWVVVLMTGLLLLLLLFELAP